MQLVVEAIMQSIPAVANVVLFGGFEFGIFGILGVQLFAGGFNRCNQAVIDGKPVEWADECMPGTFQCTKDDICKEGEEVCWACCARILILGAAYLVAAWLVRQQAMY